MDTLACPSHFSFFQKSETQIHISNIKIKTRSGNVATKRYENPSCFFSMINTFLQSSWDCNYSSHTFFSLSLPNQSLPFSPFPLIQNALIIDPVVVEPPPPTKYSTVLPAILEEVNSLLILSTITIDQASLFARFHDTSLSN